jgi:carboxyl-terminal processing protease
MASTAALLLCVLPAWSADAVDLDTVSRAADAMEAHWVGEIDSEAMTRAAIQGMLEYLDSQQGHPGNALLASGDLPHVGWRQGIGVEYLALPGHGMLVTQVFEASPAAKAGIAPGDTVIAMGAWSFAGRSRPEIHAIVLQQADPAVNPALNLEVASAEGMRRRVALVRGPFQIAPVRSMSRARVPTLRIHHFATGTAKAIQTALGDGFDCLVLDLRDNPGGSLEEAVESAGLFLPPDVVVARLSHRGGGEESLTAKTKPVQGGPVAILVNGGTSEMAELFTAALQRQGRALVVGVPTAGVGGIAQEHVLEEDMHLWIVDTSLHGPRGETWTGEGLQPDVVVGGSRATMVSLHSAPPDLQLEAATRLLDCSN